jgi:hypothetical protein
MKILDLTSYGFQIEARSPKTESLILISPEFNAKMTSLVDKFFKSKISRMSDPHNYSTSDSIMTYRSSLAPSDSAFIATVSIVVRVSDNDSPELHAVVSVVSSALKNIIRRTSEVVKVKSVVEAYKVASNLLADTFKACVDAVDSNDIKEMISVLDYKSSRSLGSGIPAFTEKAEISKKALLKMMRPPL